MFQKKYVPLISFLAGAVITLAFSTYATDIGTNATITGSLFATSTVQATGNIVGYSNLLLGTTTPWKGASYAFEQRAGTQPVFLVGDTGTSTPYFVISPKGQVLIGTAAPLTDQTNLLYLDNSTTGAFFTQRLVNNTTIRFASEVYSDSPSAASQFNLRHARGTPASPTVTVDGDNLGSFRWGGYINGAFAAGAVMQAVADGEWYTSSDTTDNPTKIDFQTVPDGSATLTTRMTINNAGNVGIGTTTPASVFSVSTSATTTAQFGTTSSTQGSCFQLYSPNHTAYRVYVANNGTLTTQAGTCE